MYYTYHLYQYTVGMCLCICKYKHTELGPNLWMCETQYLAAYNIRVLLNNRKIYFIRATRNKESQTLSQIVKRKPLVALKIYSTQNYANIASRLCIQMCLCWTPGPRLQLSGRCPYFIGSRQIYSFPTGLPFDDHYQEGNIFYNFLPEFNPRSSQCKIILKNLSTQWIYRNVYRHKYEKRAMEYAPKEHQGFQKHEYITRLEDSPFMVSTNRIVQTICH